jgi:hypothetical protein
VTPNALLAKNGRAGIEEPNEGQYHQNRKTQYEPD